MAVSILCAVRDSASGLYGRPAQFVNLAVAVRAFQQEISSSENNAMNTHPEDFELHEIGTYNDETAQLISTSPTTLVARGKDVRQQLQQQQSS